MAKYSKWIGGGLGWAFGGPIGGILGFIFGSMYDGMQSSSQNSSAAINNDFSVSLLVLSAAVMKADEKILRSELEYIKAFFIRQFGIEATKEKMLLLREIIKQEIPLDEVAAQIKQYMDYSSRLQLLHFLYGIAAADNDIDVREIDVIARISRHLGISSPDLESIKAMFVKDIDSAYKILEVSPAASNEEIKKAYRAMAIKYHPDKVSHLGNDIQNAAKEKFQQLNAAYEDIKKQRKLN